MATIKFAKVASLPVTPAANTMYLVQNGAATAKIYVTDGSGVPMSVVGAAPEIEPFLLLGVNSGS